MVNFFNMFVMMVAVLISMDRSRCAQHSDFEDVSAPTGRRPPGLYMAQHPGMQCIGRNVISFAWRVVVSWREAVR